MNKMAIERSRRLERVDYKALNSISSADNEPKFASKKKYKQGSKTYQVERLISRRTSKNKGFEYLVKWQHWPLWTCTWEPSVHLNEHLIRAYKNPAVCPERIQKAASLLLEAILSILKSNATKVMYSVEVKIEHDIVRHVFSGKGKESADKKYMLYEKGDFCKFQLPDYWDYYLNELGQGIAIDFPVKLKSILSFGKKRYLVKNGKINRAPCPPIEKVVIFVNRKACDSNNII